MTKSALASQPAPPAAFARDEPGVGRFALRPLEPAADAAMVHGWVTAPHAGFWNMADKSEAEIEAFYRGLEASGHAEGAIGLFQDRPAFLAEFYDPRFDQVGEHYEPAPGDRGMHVLAAPAGRRVPGFTLGVMRAVMAFLFADPATARVVVEPDIRNDRIHRLNRRVGFSYDRPVVFREKTAHLAFCTRAAFEASLAGVTDR